MKSSLGSPCSGTLERFTPEERTKCLDAFAPFAAVQLRKPKRKPRTLPITDIAEWETEESAEKRMAEEMGGG